MGINSCILDWFAELAQHGLFQANGSILELGPQDIFFPEEQFLNIAVSRIGRDRADNSVTKVFDSALPFRDRQQEFYRIFGLNEYRSVDTYDERADYRLDLNYDDRPPRLFDLVVDCGTSEHVFNIANVFVFTHNALRRGGICLKVLPTYGDNTHGFYNIHPTTYFDIARVNGYEIIDFRYIDNMSGRSADRGAASLLSSAEFAAGLLSFRGCAALQSIIRANFKLTAQQAESDGRIADGHSAVDYCFVAMKKTRDEKFRYPGQGVYLTEFSS